MNNRGTFSLSIFELSFVCSGLIHVIFVNVNLYLIFPLPNCQLYKFLFNLLNIMLLTMLILNFIVVHKFIFAMTTLIYFAHFLLNNLPTSKIKKMDLRFFVFCDFVLIFIRGEICLRNDSFFTSNCFIFC